MFLAAECGVVLAGHGGVAARGGQLW
jgi:hypothetical protein